MLTSVHEERLRICLTLAGFIVYLKHNNNIKRGHGTPYAIQNHHREKAQEIELGRIK